MAAVPVDWQPQEHEAALPTARIESVASPALLDAGAEQTEKLGAGIVAAGTGVAQVAYHMAQRENADVLFQNEAADKAAYIDYEANLRATRQGAKAKGAASDTAAWWKDRISKNMENMNDDQQRLYAKRIADVQFQSIHNVSQFEAHQTEIAHDQSWAADKTNTINYAAATPTPGIIATQIAELRKFNAYQAERKGWTPEVLQAENGKDITQLHQQAIQTLAVSDPAAAAEYFKQHELEIDGSKRAEIGEFAKKATAANVGMTAAQTEWDLHGPKTDTDAASIDVMSKNIRDQFKNDPYTRDAALRQLHQIDAERDKAIKARDNQRTAAVNSMLMAGKSLAAVQQTPAWAALDGTEQRKIMEHEEQIASVREGRAYTREARQQLSLKKGGFEILAQLQDPDALISYVGGDRNKLINLRTAIGDEYAMKLINEYDRITKSAEALAASRIDNDTFKALAVKAGLNPDKKGLSEEDKDRLVLLKQNVNTRLENAAKTAGRPLTPQQRTEEATQAFNDTAKVPGFWSIGGYGTGTDRPIGALTADEMKSAVAVVDGTPVKLSTIDPKWAMGAQQRAQQEIGRPLTAKELAAGWLKKNAPKTRGSGG